MHPSLMNCVAKCCSPDSITCVRVRCKYYRNIQHIPLHAAEQDFPQISPVLFLDSGEAVASVAVPLHDDDLVEDDKVYLLTLEAVPGNPVVFVEPSQASLLVRDDDGQSKHQSA